MLKVLLVDDEFLVRMAFTNTINWKEHELELIGTAGNGEEAYEVILKECPDIVITDLTMPRMGGLELIEKVHVANIKCEFVVLSCHNEFEYAKQSIKLGVFDYILKLSMDMNELLDILERLKKKILSERSCRLPEIKHFGQEDMAGGEYRVIVVGAGGAGNDGMDKRNEQILGFLQQMTETIMYKSVFLYKDIPVLLIWEECAGLKVLLEDVQAEVKKYLGIQVQIGVGPLVCGNEHIRESFEAAMNAYDFRFYQGEDSLAFWEEVSYPEGGDRRFSDVFFEVSKLLPMGIRRELKEAVVSSLDRIGEQKKVGPGELRMHLHELLTRLEIKVNEQSPGAVTGAMYADIYQKVNKLEYLEDIKKDLVYFIDQILEQMDLAGGNELIKNAKQYVHVHLNKDLRVQEISRFLGVNPDYFSHLFRTETGIRYIDYVNHVRIECACDRLRLSNDRIYEIGEQCGFENTNYFIKVFKKHMGMTPLDYKKEQENINS